VLHSNDRGAEGLADCGPGMDVLYIDPYNRRGGISDSHIDKRDCERVIEAHPPPRDPDEGVTRFSRPGRRTLNGTRKNDKLLGMAGNDTMNGHDGDDVIWGDRLPNTSGDDTIDGGPGDDQIWGNSGNDRIVSGPGTDRVDCGPGYDVAFVDPGDRVMDCEERH